VGVLAQVLAGAEEAAGGKWGMWRTYIGEALLVHELLELDASLLNTAGISTINNVDKSIRLIVVVPPVRPDGLLSSDIPHVEFEAIAHERLDVETLCGHNGVDVLI